MTSREIIRKLKSDGWQHVATVGDHCQFKHPVKPGRVTVPHPEKDIEIELIKSIEKQGGLKLRNS
ncbi:MAG: type II toxin-antitoxin system HicA family toxin [Desulfovibrio sp.]|nr:type II toxin-antitoxin system HicA family toxin [Desulfovibrio sp.]